MLFQFFVPFCPLYHGVAFVPVQHEENVKGLSFFSCFSCSEPHFFLSFFLFISTLFFLTSIMSLFSSSFLFRYFSFFYFFFFFFFSLSFFSFFPVFSQPSPSDLLTSSLPGISPSSPPPPIQYAGYLPIDDSFDSRLFYWLIKADEQTTEKDWTGKVPLTIWLNGGKKRNKINKINKQNKQTEMEKTACIHMYIYT